MKKRQFLALTMALAMAGAVGFTSIPTQAASLTQAERPEDVNYGQVSESDMELLKSLFDLDYYAEQNPDLVYLYGNDYEKLFEHFCKCGVFEGRSCNPNFDPSAYASAYSDLKDLFGTDILKYYQHYATVGVTENRTLTTMAACADAGITVHPINNEEIKITPQVYRISQYFGITDIKSVSNMAKAVDHAQTGDGAVVVKHVEDSSAIIAEAEELESIGTITIGEESYYVYVNYSVYAGNTGYIVYGYSYDSANYDKDYKYYENRKEVYKTADYTKKTYTYGDYTHEGYDEFITSFGVDIYMPTKNVPVTSENGEIEEYDATNKPYYQYTYEGEETTDGVRINPMFSGTSTSTSYEGDGTNKKVVRTVTTKEPVNVNGTHQVKDTGKMVGYYTDNEGNWKAFESDKEKYDYINSLTEYDESGNKVSWYSDEYTSVYYVDVNGKDTTVYNLGLNVTTNDKGNTEITFGISNKEDNFGYVGTYEVVEETTVTAVDPTITGADSSATNAGSTVDVNAEGTQNAANN